MLSVVGRPVSCNVRQVRRNQMQGTPHHCWLNVNNAAIQKSTRRANEAPVNVMGHLFYVRSVDLKFTYFESLYLSPTDQPKLNRRTLKMRMSDFKELAQTHDFTMPAVSREYNINIMSFVYDQETTKACRDYDKEHNLGPLDSTLTQVLFVNKCIYMLAERDERDMSQTQKDMKAVIVANMYVLFQRMFDVEFTHLMLFPLKLLISYFKAFFKEGPITAFEPIDFEFTREGVLKNSELHSSKLAQKVRERNNPNNNNNNNNNDNNNNNTGYVVNEQDDIDDEDDSGDNSNGGGGGGHGKFNFPKKLSFCLTYKRAVDFYRIQVEQGVADATTPNDDMDTNGNDAANEHISKKLNAIKVFDSLKKKDPDNDNDNDNNNNNNRSSVNVIVTRADGFEFVAVSTDYRKTKVNPLDMRNITEEDWIRMLLYEFIESFYNGDDEGIKHFAISARLLVDLIPKVINDDQVTPLRNLTIQKLEHVIKMMMVEKPKKEDQQNKSSFRQESSTYNRIIIYDKESKKIMTVADLERDFETPENPNFLVNGADRFVVGLGMIIGQELSTYDLLSKFVFTQSSRHCETMEEITLKLDHDGYDIDRSSNGRITFSDEQKRAIHYALMLPFVNIEAAGGRGKSEIMVKIFEILYKLYPGANFLFTSFKNDTINQMRNKLQQFMPDIHEKSNVYFRTNDSIRYAKGIRVLCNESPFIKSVDVDFMFVEEAGMSATPHINSLLKNFNLSTLKKIINFGDGNQLLPIMAGCPFVDMIKAFPDATVHLTRNYRSDNVKFNTFLDQIRTREYDNFTIDNDGLFDRDVERNFDTGCNFVVTDDLESGFQRGNKQLYLSYGKRLMKILEALEGRLQYDDIMAVSPYNTMALFISWCFNHFYFERPIMQARAAEQRRQPQQRTIESAFQIIGRRRQFDDRGEEDDSTAVLGRQHDNIGNTAQHASAFMTMEDAVNCFVKETNKNRVAAEEPNFNPYAQAKFPTKYVGEDVSFTRTDPEDKRIAQGRVGKITRMYDHLKGHKFDVRWLTNNEDVPVGFVPVFDTSLDVRKVHGQKWERTVVVDNNTEVTFASNYQLHSLLRPAKCCTVHQAQGRQGKVVFSIHPYGKLANCKIFYTSSSRAQNKCITISTPDVIEDMKNTVPNDPVSIQYDLFASDVNLLLSMKSLKDVADERIAYLTTADDDDDGDNNNNNNNNNGDVEEVIDNLFE